MDKSILKFIKTYSAEPELVNRLLVSSFLNFNNYKVINNTLIKSYYISNNSEETSVLKQFEEIISEKLENFSFENLIELFEFVISPSEKVINGAIYTPEKIREYIVQKQIESLSCKIEKAKFSDISCGCGGFLLTITKFLKQITKKSFFNIYNDNVFGLDIASYSIERTKILLSLFAISNCEDNNFKFNLYTGNALSFDWSKIDKIYKNGGFDVISGNPPYVTSRNMDKESLDLLSNWSVANAGHPDLYIPFFQIGYQNLNNNGILGYITVNTFLKSINGRSFREYIAKSKTKFKILNFGGEQIFRGRNTYTCICFITKKLGELHYHQTTSSKLILGKDENFQTYSYDSLDHFNGWNLSNSRASDEFIKKVENSGKKLNDIFTTRNGIATLKNEVYKFSPIDEDRDYFYFDKNGKKYKVEKKLCRDIINANKVKNDSDFLTLKEKIIFPYTIDENKKITIIPEQRFSKKYPFTYSYLLDQKEILSKRDKGIKKYEAWYAYGRRQSMDIDAYKLFFPHITSKPRFVLSDDRSLLFYNGIAVVSNNLRELEFLKVILESKLFHEYLLLTTKNYSSGYISMSKNYIKNFTILEVSEELKSEIINSEDPDKILERLYGVKL